ncbi:MAG: hypothetical protein HY874_02115 [Chloroflexi bacterium]|nr:hypothetical protein [Chloroflexota bacterium]
MPRGGKRPGAGAPIGNMNGLKHGAHSPRVRAVMQALAENPESRAVFIELGRRGALRRARTREMVLALARLMHDRPIAEEARRRLDQIVDARDAAVERDAARDAVARYEHTTRERLHAHRIDADIDRVAIEDLKAKLADLQAATRVRRLAQQLRRINARLARATLPEPRNPEP